MSGEDIFQRGFELKKISIDNTFPNYIVENQAKFSKWIA